MRIDHNNITSIMTLPGGIIAGWYSTCNMPAVPHFGVAVVQQLLQWHSVQWLGVMHCWTSENCSLLECVNLPQHP